MQIIQAVEPVLGAHKYLIAQCAESLTQSKKKSYLTIALSLYILRNYRSDHTSHM